MQGYENIEVVLGDVQLEPEGTLLLNYDIWFPRGQLPHSTGHFYAALGQSAARFCIRLGLHFPSNTRCKHFLHGRKLVCCLVHHGHLINQNGRRERIYVKRQTLSQPLISPAPPPLLPRFLSPSLSLSLSCSHSIQKFEEIYVHDHVITLLCTATGLFSIWLVGLSGVGVA